MARPAQPEGCFWITDGCTGRSLQAVCLGAELFSSSHQQQSASGISEHYIRFTDNRTEVFHTARYSALVRVKSMGPLITVVKTALALFMNSLPGPLGNGTRECFTASRPEATATVRSAISL